MKSLNEISESWELLNDTKLFRKVPNSSVVVVVPKGYETITVPLFCPCCNLPMKTREDAEMYKIQKSCAPCSLYFGKKASDPSKIDYDSVEWEEYLNKRLLSAKPIVNII